MLKSFNAGELIGGEVEVKEGGGEGSGEGGGGERWKRGEEVGVEVEVGEGGALGQVRNGDEGGDVSVVQVKRGQRRRGLQQRLRPWRRR